MPFFKEHYIVKDVDTFQIELSKKHFYFDGDEIIKGKTDALKLETSKETHSQHMFVYKKNDATNYMD